MKKTFLLIGLITMVLGAVFAQTGTIRELSGEVELKPAGAAAFTPARAGSTVAQDTIISTGFKSTAVVVIGSNTITVRPLTRLSLAEITRASDTETLNVNLQTGRIRVEVRPPAGARASTQVQSPSATASVRGTVFEMDTLNLSVQEGRVMFMGTDGLNVQVTAGSASAITVDGGSVEPVIISEAELTPPAPVGIGSSPITPSPPPVPDVQIDLVWGLTPN